MRTNVSESSLDSFFDLKKSSTLQDQQRKITQGLLKKLLNYDPKTGIFIWKEIHSKSRHVSVGDEAGSIRSDKYSAIKLFGKAYLAHRLAWLYMTGEWPINDIDHINLVRNDNRIANLRLATKAENMRNRPIYKNNTSGAKGVVFVNGTRWRVRVSYNGKKIHLGYFTSLKLAKEAYQKFSIKNHGDFIHSETRKTVQALQLKIAA